MHMLQGAFALAFYCSYMCFCLAFQLYCQHINFHCMDFGQNKAACWRLAVLLADL